LRNYALDYVVIGAIWLLIGMLLGIVMGARGGLSACGGSCAYQSYRICLSFDLWYSLQAVADAKRFQTCSLQVLDIRHFNTDYVDWPCFHSHRRAGSSHNPWLYRGIGRRRAILLDGLARAVRGRVSER
jgi:hypothetical protein